MFSRLTTLIWNTPPEYLILYVLGFSGSILTGVWLSLLLHSIGNAEWSCLWPRFCLSVLIFGTLTSYSMNIIKDYQKAYLRS